MLHLCIGRIAIFDFNVYTGMMDWIDINDKLPNNYTDVLIINKSGFQHVVHYNNPNFLYKPNIGIESRIFHDHREPTHWMPLPQKPLND